MSKPPPRGYAEKAAAGAVRIGISGWRYKGWRGVFYPKGLPQRAELAYAAGIFNSIEINGTFYRLQKPEFFRQWADATPKDFVFAVKGSRFITHMLKLKDARPALARYFAQGVLEPGPKLGPILWQFPEQFRFNAERLEAFFKLLPRDTIAAAELARTATVRKTGRRVGRKTPAGVVDRPLRHAIEIRHKSFRDPAFIELLRAHNVALVVADTVEWPLLMDVTSDFVYCRLHGSEVLYASGYGEDALQTWATRIAAWARGGEPDDAIRASPRPAPRAPSRDVYVYFDNDAKVRAPFDAQRLKAIVDEKLG
ncbi:MAG TPA: DUF72 domain-containing protein [Alphaproteobacteria bacterium]